MRVDTQLKLDVSPDAVADQARQIERDGYDAIWAGEEAHDPVPSLAIAAEHTSRTRIGTSILVAFARTPMTVAYSAWELQRMSQGRFILGLGSQVQAHVERRFSMPWSRPAAQMEEFVAAFRAIWSSWTTGGRLNFSGDFYTHTLMPEFFRPPVAPLLCPPIHLAAVGPRMTAVAGRAADGLIVHPFTTAEFLEQETLPALAAARGNLDGFEVRLSGLVATGRDEAELMAARAAVKAQIAFYASTPAYLPVLARHGWEELGAELHRRSRNPSDTAWTNRAELIDDQILGTFAVVAEPGEVTPEIVRRFGKTIDRFAFYTPYQLDPELRRRLANDLCKFRPRTNESDQTSQGVSR